MLQACRYGSTPGIDTHIDLGDGMTEQMWINPDGTPYLYYSTIVYFPSNVHM